MADSRRRIISPSEALAIDPRCIRSDRRAVWWDYGPPVLPNEYVETETGSLCVVHVRGSLEHHADVMGDSYDGMRERVSCALEDDGEAVVLRIDSPGGVVSGLDEFVRWLRKQSAEHRKPLYAYVDEMAASAAYAILCGCDAACAPKAAIVGSIGVISTLHDQVEADKRMGLRFVTITSGARKSDGHPHVSVSDTAIEVEEARVRKYAAQFYRLVSEGRPIPLADLKSTRGFQAGIFLGRKAEKMGLVDEVASWEEFLASVTLDSSGKVKSHSKRTSPVSDAKGNETDRRADDEEPMLSLKAELKKLEARAAAEKDPERAAALALTVASMKATIEAAKKITHEKHEKKTVTDDGGSDEGDEDDSGDDEDDSGDDEDDSGDDEDDSGDDDDDSDEDDEEESAKYEEDEESARKESEEEEAAAAVKSLRASLDAGARKLVRRAVKRAVRSALKKSVKRHAGLVEIARAARVATGQKSTSAIAGALAALPSRKAADAALKAEVERLKSNDRRAKVSARIDAALKDGRITKAEVESLRAAGMKDPKWLKGHLAARPKMIRRAGEAFVPREGTVGAPSTDEQRAMMAAATAGMSDEQRKAFEAEQASRLAKITNGHPTH